MASFDLNRDALTGPADTASMGPRLGFLGAFDQSFDAQVRGWSMYGLEYSFYEIEQEQNDRIRAAGLKPPGGLNDDAGRPGLFSPFSAERHRYMDTARYFVDGGTPEDAAMIAERDAAIRKLGQENPDLNLRDYRSMWEETQRRAQIADRSWSNAGTSFGGMVGGFVGGVLGSIQPETDPLNALTLGVGGAGKTVIRRLATQGGAQGVIEAVDQFTGVQENRRLLGLSHSPWEAAAEIGMGVAGGVALQGVGEGLVAGARKLTTGRWFADTPNDPAPPPPPPPMPEMQGPPVAPPRPASFLPRPDAAQLELPMHLAAEPYGPTRLATARANEDLEAVSRQLDTWDGPAPHEVVPYVTPGLNPVRSLTVDELARQIEPQGFRLFDNYKTDLEVLRRQLRAADASRAPGQVSDAAALLDQQIADTQARLESTRNKRTQAKMREEIAELQKQRDTALKAVVPKPETEALRARVMRLDEKLRDIAPVINRARAAAQGEFAAKTASQTGEFFDVPVRDWHQQRLPFMKTIANRQRNKKPVIQRPQAEQGPPLTVRSPELDALPATADAADRTAVVVAAQMKVVDDAVDRFRGELNKMVGGEIEVAPVVHTGTTTRARFTDTSGAVDAGRAADELVAEVDAALRAGGKVVYTVEGKNVPIVAVERGMMADAKKQRWGVMQLLAGKDDSTKLTITLPKTTITVNGRTLDLVKDKIATGNMNDKGEPVTVSVKQFLADLQKDEDLLASAGSCSIGGPVNA